MSVIDSVVCDMFICDGKCICLSPLFEAFLLYKPVMYCSSYSNADDDNNNFSSIFVLWPSFPQLMQFRMIAPWGTFCDWCSSFFYQQNSILVIQPTVLKAEKE